MTTYVSLTCLTIFLPCLLVAAGVEKKREPRRIRLCRNVIRYWEKDTTYTMYYRDESSWYDYSLLAEGLTGFLNKERYKILLKNITSFVCEINRSLRVDMMNIIMMFVHKNKKNEMNLLLCDLWKHSRGTLQAEEEAEKLLIEHTELFLWYRKCIDDRAQDGIVTWSTKWTDGEESKYISLKEGDLSMCLKEQAYFAVERNNTSDFYAIKNRFTEQYGEPIYHVHTGWWCASQCVIWYEWPPSHIFIKGMQWPEGKSVYDSNSNIKQGFCLFLFSGGKSQRFCEKKVSQMRRRYAAKKKKRRAVYAVRYTPSQRAVVTNTAFAIKNDRSMRMDSERSCASFAQ